MYWIAKESEKHEEIESLLKRNAGHLRHELSALRVMGQVPNIVFVKGNSGQITLVLKIYSMK